MVTMVEDMVVKVKVKVTVEKLLKKWVIASLTFKILMTETCGRNVLIKCGKVFLCDSTLAKHMKTHEMQRSQWHHWPRNKSDFKFKSKYDLKCHTEAHEALDSGKTHLCDNCDYVGKIAKRLGDHKQRHK